MSGPIRVGKVGLTRKIGANSTVRLGSVAKTVAELLIFEVLDPQDPDQSGRIPFAIAPFQLAKPLEFPHALWPRTGLPIEPFRFVGFGRRSTHFQTALWLGFRGRS